MNRRYTKEELYKRKCLPTQEEVNNLPYDTENAYIQIPLNLETGVKIFYCFWNKHLIYAPSVTGPWRFDSNDTLILSEHLPDQEFKWLKPNQNLERQKCMMVSLWSSLAVFQWSFCMLHGKRRSHRHP
jgi:hypothetical protein